MRWVDLKTKHSFIKPSGCLILTDFWDFSSGYSKGLLMCHLSKNSVSTQNNCKVLRKPVAPMTY